MRNRPSGTRITVLKKKKPREESRGQGLYPDQDQKDVTDLDQNHEKRESHGSPLSSRSRFADSYNWQRLQESGEWVGRGQDRTGAYVLARNVPFQLGDPALLKRREWESNPQDPLPGISGA